MRASRAFTLIELLVVIAVIAILAALLLSVLSRVTGRLPGDHLPEQSPAMGHGDACLRGRP